MCVPRRCRGPAWSCGCYFPSVVHCIIGSVVLHHFLLSGKETYGDVGSPLKISNFSGMVFLADFLASFHARFAYLNF